MPYCPCESEKKPSAPQYININDIGVLCFALGLQGTLCRLLDLVPNAIKAIAQLDPDNLGINNERIINKLLDKVIKRIGQIAIDDLTGNISVARFCTLEPPPAPQDITYSDIYQFIADLVPILGRFFKFNDVLAGNNTKLLDKIVAIWLRQQWFLHCQCKDCEKPELKPPPSPPPLYGYNIGCADIRNENVDAYNQWILDEYAVQIAQYGDFAAMVAQDNLALEAMKQQWRDYASGVGGSIEFGSEKSQGQSLSNIPVVYRRRGFGCQIVFLRGLYYFPEGPTGYYPILNGSRVGGVNVTVRTIPTFILDTKLDSSGCDCPPPPPPPEFCAIFPDDPLCRVSGCTDPSAKNYNPDANYDDGSCAYYVDG